MKIKIFLKIAIIFFLLGSCGLSKSYAFELALGVSTVEEGDDRLRPAALFHLGLTDSLYANTYIYGRTYGPVTEKTFVSSFNYRFALYKKDSALYGSLGATTLVENTSIEASEVSGNEDIDKKQYNFGMAFGFSFIVPMDLIYISFNWDSHVYPAGVAGILFATGRKQMMSIATGVHF